MPQGRFQRCGVWDTCCEFSLPICFLTNWKMNEYVYISSTCPTQVGDWLGRVICSLSKALAISRSESVSVLAASFPWPRQTLPPILSAFLPGSGYAQHGQQPYNMWHSPAHKVLLSLVLSLLCFEGLMCRGCLRFSPFCQTLYKLRAGPEGIDPLF